MLHWHVYINVPLTCLDECSIGMSTYMLHWHDFIDAPQACLYKHCRHACLHKCSIDMPSYMLHKSNQWIFMMISFCFIKIMTCDLDDKRNSDSILYLMWKNKMINDINFFCIMWTWKIKQAMWHGLEARDLNLNFDSHSSTKILILTFIIQQKML